MNRLLKSWQELALNAGLWAQRINWPVPAAIRRSVRNLLTRAIEPTIAHGPDEWLHPLIPGARNDASARFQGINSTAPSKSTSLTDGSIGPFTSPQLRCLVTTHSLDVGGLDRFAVFLALRLPSFGIDTTIAHTPITDTPHTGSGDALGGPRVLKLSPSEAHKWLKTN